MELGVRNVYGTILAKIQAEGSMGHRKEPSKATAGCTGSPGSFRPHLHHHQETPGMGYPAGKEWAVLHGWHSGSWQFRGTAWIQHPLSSKGPGWHSSVAIPSTWSTGNISLLMVNFKEIHTLSYTAGNILTWAKYKWWERYFHLYLKRLDIFSC